MGASLARGDQRGMVQEIDAREAVSVSMHLGSFRLDIFQ